MIKKLIFQTIFLLIVSSVCHANVTLPWSTTFSGSGCPENGNLSGGAVSLSCMETWTTWGNGAGTGCSATNTTLIKSTANNPDGGGGGGAYHCVSGEDCGEGTGKNCQATNFGLFFADRPSEIWVRFYFKVSAGFSWNYLQESKLAWNDSGSTGYAHIFSLAGDTYRFWLQGMSSETVYGTAGKGWPIIGDGNWHYMEYHVKQGSGGTGRVEAWSEDTDGSIIKVIDQAVTLTTAEGGYDFIGFMVNSDSIATTEYMMMDDISISSTGYIGPLESEGEDDEIAPIITAFGMPSTASSLTVNVTSFTATDAVGVTGYCITTVNSSAGCSWSGSAPTTTTGVEGANTFYAWARDASLNVSTASTDTTTITLPPAGDANLLLSESFDNTSFSTRGWYDGAPSSIATSGCQAGAGCVQWSFGISGTNPTQMTAGAMRHLLSSATDEMYVKFYIKFATGWRGSQQLYHPHMIFILSDLDSDYQGMANAYLDTYIEFISDIGSPYEVRPQLAIQDSQRVNTSNGTPPNNLSATTENRSVGYCNTPSSAGATGDCYQSGSWWSAASWLDSGHDLSINSWHIVEAYFKMNTISGSVGQHDGIMQEWVDGVQVINHSDVLYRTNQDATKKWDQFVIAPYIGDGSPIAQSFYMDELEVYDAMPDVPAVTAALIGSTCRGCTITH